MTEELKRCPFCNKKGKVQESVCCACPRCATDGWIGCSNLKCKFNPTVRYSNDPKSKKMNIQSAITAWNTRHEDDINQKYLQKIKALQARIDWLEKDMYKQGN